MATGSGSSDQSELPAHFHQERTPSRVNETLISTPTFMTERERMRRIAQLLCKAIWLLEAGRAIQPRTQDYVTRGLTDPNSIAGEAAINEDKRVLSYLQLAGQASPIAIRSALGLNRSSLYRALRRLSGDGRVAASGQTRTLVYSLNSREPSPEKIHLN